MAWINDIKTFLALHHIAYEVATDISYFDVIMLPKSAIWLHFIDHATFEKHTPSPHFFQELSSNFNNQDQRIIHLWEDVWTQHKDLVQSRILAMSGHFSRLNARHCYLERIDMPTAEHFLAKNHLQGSVKSKFKYGLFLKAQYVEKFLGASQIIPINQSFLIAVATFSAGRTMKYGDREGTRSYELLRFASLKNHVVVGGMDKLLNAFINEHQPDDLMSYADRDWSDGRSYETLGFTKIENTEPQYFWLDPLTQQRYALQRHTDSEQELIKRGFIKIFNAGSIKYLKLLNNKS
jgi:hypothetical protein